MPLGLLLVLGAYSSSVLVSCMRQCSCLFLGMVVRHVTEGKERFGITDETTSGVCEVLRGWIKFRMELCGVTKGVDRRIERCSPVVRPCRENERNAKRLHVGGCTGSYSVGLSRKRWNDTVNDCLKKLDFDVRQARTMVHNISEWPCFL